MTREEYNVLIAQMAATIFSGFISGFINSLSTRSGVPLEIIKAAPADAVKRAKEIARLSGIEEPKEGPCKLCEGTRFIPAPCPAPTHNSMRSNFHRQACPDCN